LFAFLMETKSFCWKKEKISWKFNFGKIKSDQECEQRIFTKKI
jgi:hypothetical protein